MSKQDSYKRNIIKHLYFSGQLSCAELSQLTDKSLPLTTKVLNELIEEGSVQELGYALSTGGRRPQTYSLKSDLMYVVAVAMDQLITRMAIVDMRNNLIGEVEKVELKLNNNPKAAEELRKNILKFIEKSTIPKSKIAGIGIGMPGFIDVLKGINHSFLKISEGSIVSYIESEVGLPVLIDNDSSLIALAELRLGEAKNRQNVMVININWGVGLGMILNGELFRGYNGFAGEFSHIPLFTNNKMCSCGKSGCLETETSLLVVAEKAVEGLKKGKVSRLKNLVLENIEETAAAIMDAADKGDKFAVELFSEAGYNIGRGVAILIHLLNPELIVLSGRGAGVGKLWLAPIQQAINEHCIPKIAENTEIKISSLGFQAELIGAAALVMENFDMLDSALEKKSFDDVVA
ncbi:ROK family protein [Flavisolibacter ginsengisoli]|uniref:Sugar kinase of the NBD/HSP70 family, may contain an N-terminal HTH domain n=1 Tax=Flavisolibacter ginsengisoli DSM 18119 TaxID=1121884 RepID=A0A1M5A6E5_9BACT|nr:ROK family protein [Flavisolibacter ginsengisoli]SHF25878.1 Sugar kinase of the NBD/HSP70 family, may contain an N-terminal HTH domain [Flavisolibacter ginsengisoli DSM 18119]